MFIAVYDFPIFNNGMTASKGLRIIHECVAECTIMLCCDNGSDAKCIISGEINLHWKYYTGMRHQLVLLYGALYCLH